MNPPKRNVSQISRQNKFTFLAFLAETTVIPAALSLGYWYTFQEFSLPAFVGHQWKLILYCLFLYPFFNLLFGTYRRAYTSAFRAQMFAAMKSFALATLTVFATLFLYGNTYYSHGAPVTFLLMLPAGLLGIKLCFLFIRRRLRRIGWGIERAVTVLFEEHGKRAIDRFALRTPSSYEVVAAIEFGGKVSERRMFREVLGALHDSGAGTVVAGGVSLDALTANPFLEELLRRGIRVRLVSPEIHQVLDRSRLYEYEGIAYPSHDGSTAVLTQGQTARAMDLTISGLLILMSLPIALLLAVAVKLESHGSILFRQVRALSGSSGRLEVYKFRSMKDRADELPRENTGEQSADLLYKQPRDPRLTRVGRFIRRFSLDELPQLLNVVKGEMALVGPRPLPAKDYAKITRQRALVELNKRRSVARPGITGLWQISGRSELTFREMVLLDLCYIENHTLLFDIEILAHTIPVVLFGRGGY